MGSTLSIIGNHSVQFNNSALRDASVVIERLNSLELDKSGFLNEMCIAWHTSIMNLNADTSSKENSKLERCLELKEWKILYIDDDNLLTDSTCYELEGPYGLILDLNKYYFEFSIWIGRYFQWFMREGDDNMLWREKWRQIIYRITHVLGGDYVLYFPDSNYDLSYYWLCNFSFPQGMENTLKCNIKNLDQAVEAISNLYAEPITLTEADRVFDKDNEVSFVVDRFDDLDKTLEI